MQHKRQDTELQSAMDEVVRKIDNDRKTKGDAKNNAKSRFLTKEFSQPVMSFNDMVLRKKRHTIEKAGRQYKLFRFQQDREIDDITNFKQSLLHKTLDFDAGEFHESFERPKTPYVPDFTYVRQALRTLPANKALDFPTAVRPPSRKIQRIDTGKPSTARRKHRPATSFTNSTRSQKFEILKRTRPKTANVLLSRSVESIRQSPRQPSSENLQSPRLPSSETLRSPRQLSSENLQSPRQQFSKTLETGKSPTENENTDECYGQNFLMKCKSYRYLKDKYTCKEIDIPVVDTKSLKIKHLKLLENRHAELIDKKVKLFMSEVLPGDKRKFKYQTDVGLIE